MKAEDWVWHVSVITNTNNEEQINLLGQMLAEAEEAKQILRNKGYGWTGLSLLKTIEEEVPDRNDIC